MKVAFRKLWYVLGGVALLAGLLYAFIPPPAEFEPARVERGTLQVTVNEDGKTRIKERYLVSAPLSGHLLRVELHEGDAVSGGKTVLATLEPGDPSLLDVRTEAQAEAKVRAATANREHATARLNAARATAEYAQAEQARNEKLLPSGAVSRSTYEEVVHELRLANEAQRAAEFAVQIAEFELELAQAALLYARPSEGEFSNRLEIRAPVDGVVLRVDQESDAIVAAGTPLMEVGDPRDLEVEIDVLSSDAVRITPGATVLLEHWGDSLPLRARVRLVERQAFLKISALGVEEQRVNVLADFEDPPAARQNLGDAYHVEARIVIWEGKNVLKVNAGALFREGDRWVVYRVSDGRAHRQYVRIGHSNGLETEIFEGLQEGDTVIAYPTDQIRDGARVTPR